MPFHLRVQHPVLVKEAWLWGREGGGGGDPGCAK